MKFFFESSTVRSEESRAQVAEIQQTVHAIRSEETHVRVAEYVHQEVCVLFTWKNMKLKHKRPF